MLFYLFIAAYLVLILIRPQEYPGWPYQGVPLLPIALVGSLAIWMLSRNKRFDAPQYLLVVLFLLATCLSVLMTGWAGGALKQFTDFIATIVSFVLLANAIDTPRKRQMIMALFVLCAAVLAMHGAGQAANGIGWTGMPLVNDGRIQYLGIFSDPNDIGMLFVMCVPMALHLSAQGGLMGLRRLFWLVACLLLLYGIYLTHSRGALLAVIAMAGVYIWFRRGPALAVVLGGVAMVAVQFMSSRMADIEVGEESAMGRVEAWYEGLHMLAGNPVFGVGTGMFTEYHYLTAHNSFVLVLAENGLFGFTIWLAFVGYCFMMMHRIVRHDPEFVVGEEDEALIWQQEQRVAFTLLVSLSGFFTTAFFLSRSYVILLYLLAALVVANFSLVRTRFPSLEPFSLQRDWWLWPILAVLATIGLYIMMKVLLVIA